MNTTMMTLLRISNVFVIICFVSSVLGYENNRVRKQQQKHQQDEPIQYPPPAVTRPVIVDRELQFWNDDLASSPTFCGVSGFSIFNSTSNTTVPLDMVQYFSSFPQSKILLDRYPGHKINIFAETDTTGCLTNATTIGCVILKWGNFAKSTEHWVPYTLFKNDPRTNTISTWPIPSVSGFQPLEAWAYESSSCTGSPINYLRTDVQVIPKTTQAIKVTPVVATYNGVTKQPRPGNKAAVVKETCSFIKDAFSMGFTYKGALSVESDTFRCWSVKESLNTTSTNATNSTKILLPPTITYHVRLSFTISGEVSEYLNPDMPTQVEVTRYVGQLFRDEVSLGAGAENEYMSTVLKAVLQSTNPYGGYTKITTM
jgi:hypothetical protein